MLYVYQALQSSRNREVFCLANIMNKTRFFLGFFLTFDLCHFCHTNLSQMLNTADQLRREDTYFLIEAPSFEQFLSSSRARLLRSRRNSFVFNNFVVLSFLNASAPQEEVVSWKYGSSSHKYRHALVEQTRLIEYGGQQLACAKEKKEYS